MGDLVVMSRPKSLPAREYLAGHSAEILFFTGVRYYRMDDSADVTAVALGAPKLGKRRRSASQLIAAKRLRGTRKALA